MIRILADNFVSDHSQPEVIALGINTISEIFLRIPLLFEEEELEPLIHEIVEYKSYKDKGVVIAARNFMNVCCLSLFSNSFILSFFLSFFVSYMINVTCRMQEKSTPTA